MAYFTDNLFQNVDVRLDGHVFHRCRFENCTLIYGGSGPVGMTGCVFLNVRWAFVEAASNTLTFMASLFRGAGEGGRQVIEQTFEAIRRGPPPRPQPTQAPAPEPTEAAASSAPTEGTVATAREG
jgi:hypothetical protein